MSIGPTQFNCPHCQGLFQVPPAAGPQTVACPHCNQHVQIAASAPAAAGEDPMAPLLVAPRTAVTPTTGLPSQEPQDESGSRSSTGSSSLWPRVAGMTIGVLLVAGLLWAGLTYGLPALRTSTASSGGSSASNASSSSSAAMPEGWTNANDKTLRTAGFEVKVMRIERGPVLGRRDDGTMTNLDEDALSIFLRVKNVSDHERTYQSWYAASADEAAAIRAELADDRDVVYPLEYFAGTTKLRGHSASTTLAPSQRVDDVVVFDIPQEADLSAVANWRLQLDGSLLGTGEPFRFAIPRAMLTTYEQPQAPPATGDATNNSSPPATKYD